MSVMAKHVKDSAEILTTITQLVKKTLNLEEIYRTASDLVMNIEHVDMVMVYLVDEDVNEAVLEAHRNVPEDYLQRASRIPHPKGITWKVIESNKPLNVRDAQTDSTIGPAGKALGKHGVLGMPITLSKGGKSRGVIWLWSDKEYEFNEDEVKLLYSVGNQIATAVAWGKLYKERRLRMEAALKDLTNLVGLTKEDIALLKENSEQMNNWTDEIIRHVFDVVLSYESVANVMKEGSLDYENALREFYTALCRGDIGSDFWENQWMYGLLSVIRNAPLPLTLSLISQLDQHFFNKCYQGLDPAKAERVYRAFKKASHVLLGMSAEGYLDAYSNGVGITSGFSKALLQRMARLGAERMYAKIRG